MTHNLSDNVLTKQVIAPQAVAAGASVNGTGVDTTGYEYLQANIQIGAIVAAANKTVTVKLEESANNSTWADIASMATGAIANAGQNASYLIDLNLSERKRYVRATATGGSADGGLVGVSFNLSTGRHLPPTQEKTVISG